MPTFNSLVSTSFTGPDESPISQGGVWTQSSSVDAMRVASNKGSPSATLGNDSGSHFTGVTFGNDQYSRATLTVNGTSGGGSGIGLGVRIATGARTLYRFVIDHAGANNAQLARFVAGVNTQIDQWTQTFNDGDQFTLAIEGSIVYVFRGDTQVRSKDDTGGGGPSSGSPGILYSSTETSASMDDWDAGNFATASPGPGALIDPAILI